MRKSAKHVKDDTRQPRRGKWAAAHKDFSQGASFAKLHHDGSLAIEHYVVQNIVVPLQETMAMAIIVDDLRCRGEIMRLHRSGELDSHMVMANTCTRALVNDRVCAYPNDNTG